MVDVYTYRERELNKTLTSPTRSPPLRRGKVSPRLPVPDHIQKPPYTSLTLLPEISSEYQVHDAEGIAHMRAACKLAAQVLEYAGTLVRVSFFNIFYFGIYCHASIVCLSVLHSLAVESLAFGCIFILL